MSVDFGFNQFPAQFNAQGDVMLPGSYNLRGDFMPASFVTNARGDQTLPGTYNSRGDWLAPEFAWNSRGDQVPTVPLNLVTQQTFLPQNIVAAAARPNFVETSPVRIDSSEPEAVKLALQVMSKVYKEILAHDGPRIISAPISLRTQLQREEGESDISFLERLLDRYRTPDEYFKQLELHNAKRIFQYPSYIAAALDYAKQKAFIQTDGLTVACDQIDVIPEPAIAIEATSKLLAKVYGELDPEHVGYCELPEDQRFTGDTLTSTYFRGLLLRYSTTDEYNRELIATGKRNLYKHPAYLSALVLYWEEKEIQDARAGE